MWTQRIFGGLTSCIERLMFLLMKSSVSFEGSPDSCFHFFHAFLNESSSNSVLHFLLQSTLWLFESSGRSEAWILLDSVKSHKLKEFESLTDQLSIRLLFNAISTP